MSTETVEKSFDVMKDLVETCRDAQAGYLIAAEHVRNAELRAFFSQQSMDRARFAAELERAARRLGDAEIPRGSGIVDRINRAWLELKQKLAIGDIGVLETVEAAERSVKIHFQQALQAGLPPEIRNVVEREAESISAAYDQVCTLRDMGGRAA